eukprot:Gb_06165 [translate_table: standard]
MKEDTVSSKVVDSKNDDPQDVSCDGQSVLIVSTMAIDLRSINYDSPFVLIVGPMAIDTSLCDLRVLTVGTMSLNADMVDSEIPILDVYGNPNEKRKKIKVEMIGLESQHQEGFTRIIDYQDTQILLEEQFCFLARETKVISGITEQCQAGFMLENAGIFDDRGNIDANINGHWNFHNKTMIQAVVIKSCTLVNFSPRFSPTKPKFSRVPVTTPEEFQTVALADVAWHDIMSDLSVLSASSKLLQDVQCSTSFKSMTSKNFDSHENKEADSRREIVAFSLNSPTLLDAVNSEQRKTSQSKKKRGRGINDHELVAETTCRGFPSILGIQIMSYILYEAIQIKNLKQRLMAESGGNFDLIRLLCKARQDLHRVNVKEIEQLADLCPKVVVLSGKVGEGEELAFSINLNDRDLMDSQYMWKLFIQEKPSMDRFQELLRLYSVEWAYLVFTVTRQKQYVLHLRGKILIIVTSTVSGKSLCYNVLVLEDLSISLMSCALYLFPTKVLAQDQLRAFLEMTRGLKFTLTMGVYDDDTPQGQ